MSVISGVLPSTTPTPKSAKFSSVVIRDGLEIQGTFVNNALQTSQDGLSLRVTKTVAQSIGTGAAGDITFPNVVGTAPAAWDTVGDINYTAPVTGLYSIEATIAWATNGVGIRNIILLVGGTNTATNQVTTSAADPVILSISGVYAATAGQIIKIQGTQTSGGPLDVTSGQLQIQLLRRTA